jgi:hypothetical protein
VTVSEALAAVSPPLFLQRAEDDFNQGAARLGVDCRLP